MKSLRKTTLALAVSTAIATMVVSNSASAVSISTNGLGQVGLIPFYNVASGWVTNITVTNTSTDKVVAFKIRFRDSYESKDARDFNVFLSPNDVWTAKVSKSGDLAVVNITDKSCTAPNFSKAEVPYQVVFASPALAGTPKASQMGHVEIIEMGVADPKEANNLVAKAAMHNSRGVPSSCDTVEKVYAGMKYNNGTYKCSVVARKLPSKTFPGNFLDKSVARSQEFCAPENVLKVSANLVSAEGIAVDIPVTMLSDFFISAIAGQDLMDEPSSSSPGLSDVSPPMAEFYSEKHGGFIGVDFSGASNSELTSIAALLATNKIQNEYMRGVGELTDWVVSFPLKSYYEEDLTSNPTTYLVDYKYFDKEEATPPQESIVIQPSPPEPTASTVSTLKYETQVLQFGSSSILGGSELYSLNDSLENANFVAGVANVKFPSAFPEGAPRYEGRLKIELARTNGPGVIYSGPAQYLKKPSYASIVGEAVIGFAVTQETSAEGVKRLTSVPHAYNRYVK